MHGLGEHWCPSKNPIRPSIVQWAPGSLDTHAKSLKETKKDSPVPEMLGLAVSWVLAMAGVVEMAHLSFWSKMERRATLRWRLAEVSHLGAGAS